MKILERGQLTIPKKYRDRYGIRQDTELDILPTENGLLIIYSWTHYMQIFEMN